MNVQLVVNSTITKNNFSRGIIYDVLTNSILHTHRSNDSPQQCNHYYQPTMKIFKDFPNTVSCYVTFSD